MLKCHLLKRYHIFFVALSRWSEWDGSNSKVTKMILIVKLLKFSFVLEAIWKKSNNIQAQSKQKFQLQIQKKERKKKEFSFFQCYFCCLWSSLVWSWIWVLYLIFRLLEGVFFFPQILVCVFVFLLFYFANDHWSLAFFSVWDYVWFQSFFLLRFIHISIIRLSVRSLKYLSLKANWSKKILRFVFIIGYWWAEKTLFSFFWLDNRTFYGIFRA